VRVKPHGLGDQLKIVAADRKQAAVKEEPPMFTVLDEGEPV
jgi:hypothetical protein